MSHEFPQILDAQVAQQVMGWERTNASGLFLACYQVWDPVGLHVDEWNPTTDPADAWQVAHRMDQLGWSLTLRMLNQKVYVQFHHTQLDLHAEVTETTPELAISRAAMLAAEQTWIDHGLNECHPAKETPDA